jgi:hypothetical protein
LNHAGGGQQQTRVVVRHQGGAGDDLVSPILEKGEKRLPEFVTGHLSITFLILEGVSHNVNHDM